MSNSKISISDFLTPIPVAVHLKYLFFHIKGYVFAGLELLKELSLGFFQLNYSHWIFVKI